jgi:hypothetical protein
VWHIELRRLVADGLVQLTTGASPRVVALPHPRSVKWTDDAAAAITAGMRAVLLTLEERSEVPWLGWGKVGVEYDIEWDYVYEAARWLIVDGLIVNNGPEGARFTTSAQPRQRRIPPTTAEEVGLQRRTPKPAPTPKPAAAATEPKPAPAATPQPKPAPKPEPPARVTSRTMVAASAKPAAAAIADEDDEDSQTLLRRLVHAAEVSAGIAAAPTRVRTPLVSPLLDTQLRLCVVLAGSDRPMLRSEISRLCLSREQQPFLVPALLDGIRRGAFARTGGAGKSGKGARFSLLDPSVLGVSLQSVSAAVESQRADRERRRSRIGRGGGRQIDA